MKMEIVTSNPSSLLKVDISRYLCLILIIYSSLGLINWYVLYVGCIGKYYYKIHMWDVGRN